MIKPSQNYYMVCDGVVILKGSKNWLMAEKNRRRNDGKKYSVGFSLSIKVGDPVTRA